MVEGFDRAVLGDGDDPVEHVAEHAAKPRRAFPQRLFRGQLRLFQPGPLEGTLQCRPELPVIDRLVQEVVGATA